AARWVDVLTPRPSSCPRPHPQTFQLTTNQATFAVFPEGTALFRLIVILDWATLGTTYATETPALFCTVASTRLVGRKDTAVTTCDFAPATMLASPLRENRAGPPTSKARPVPSKAMTATTPVPPDIASPSTPVSPNPTTP